MLVSLGLPSNSVPTAIRPAARFGALVGRSTKMRELAARVERVARSDAAVLVQGETGTGKEVVARAIHQRSRRGGGPLIVVDCGALPETLLEAELFGHARGAFTGALEARAGAIEAAHGGTVLLDEIGELPIAMQPKLLRAVESRSVRRLGETHHRAVDVRFIAATHRDLRAMVQDGSFRGDLYFRMAVLPVTVPSLRERAADIPALVEHFLPEDAAGVITPVLLDQLADRAWPGNVRELRTFVERLLALGAEEALALASEMPAAGAAAPAPAQLRLPEDLLSQSYKQMREHALAHIEREYVRALLARHGRNISAASEAAGINRSYLHRLIRRYEL
jgi:transcriptional regulator with PAS, ATPase and Fis domain